MKQQKPYGSWRSSLTAKALSGQSLRLSETRIDTARGDIYWLEGRPQEGGRTTIMSANALGEVAEVLPAPLSCRSRCHEYGGGSFVVHRGSLYFVGDTDQVIYCLDAGESRPRALSPDKPSLRFADLCLDLHRQRLLAVMEDHSVKQQGEAYERNSLVAIPLDGSQTVTPLVSGADFYSNPQVSPDGSKLTWLSWNHPHMPWDASCCWLAELDPLGKPRSPRCVAGGAQESVFQPQWSPEGELYVVSDRNNWWNLYRCCPDTGLSAICEMAAEFATPQWLFAMSCYGFLDDATVLCCYSRDGRWQLAGIDLASGTLQSLASPYSDISALRCSDGKAVFIAAGPTKTPRVVSYDGSFRELVGAGSCPLQDEDIARPQAFSCPSGELSVHGFYYPPTNSRYEAVPGERPPLIVICHGGPTGACETSLNMKIQYWTNRGFAVADINYRGSTGYGRRYRDSLKGQWGVGDVADVCNAAEHLVKQGLADPQRLIIRGSSAGGYTVLASLTFANTFKVGCSLYGIGDLEALARDTHKFEAHYCDSLVGPYPEQAALYRARSPIHHVDQLSCPVLFLQGLDDKVVPPSQAETMVAALRAKGLPVAYLTFAGEGHGFRQAASIERALEAELSFYGQLLGFAPGDAIAPLSIDNFQP